MHARHLEVGMLCCHRAQYTDRPLSLTHSNSGLLPIPPRLLAVRLTSSEDALECPNLTSEEVLLNHALQRRHLRHHI